MKKRLLSLALALLVSFPALIPSAAVTTFDDAGLSDMTEQFRFEDILEAFETGGFDVYLDQVCMIENGFIDLTPYNIHANAGYSLGDWNQVFRMDTANSNEYPPDFKPEWLVDGCYFIAVYESQRPIQFVFHRFREYGGELWGAINGWSRPGGYATPEITDDEGNRITRVGVDMISYEGIMDMWEDYGGGDLSDELCAFWLQDGGTETALHKIILYSPAASLYPPGAPNNPLDTASPWAVDVIKTAIGYRIVPFNLQNNYSQPITRAEFCSLAVTLIETATGKRINKRHIFEDDGGNVSVQKIGGLDIVYGTDPDFNLFSPERGLSRQEAAIILERLAQKGLNKQLPEGDANFSDLHLTYSNDTVTAIKCMRGTSPGIMSGLPDGTFDPLGDFTREQSIQTMVRLYEWVKG
ncbi:MAG: S-layer homology domain-containing protein [Oscillospiraceae bacterium]|nr:S-layer homology domain-containing protein [Oscillospiraceae bacterium]